MFLLLLVGSLTMSCAERTCDVCEQMPCSFFFCQLENAFTDDKDIVYQLQQVFFPVGMLPPGRVDINIQLTLDNVPKVDCDTFLNENGGRDSPTDISTLCAMYGCISSEPYRFEHRWIRSIINFVIEREELVFLESVNFVAYATSFFNHIDFSRRNLELPDGNDTSAVDPSDSEVQFRVRIRNLPCIPEESVMLDAWEDILPWVSNNHSYIYIITHVSKLRTFIAEKSLCSGRALFNREY